LCCVVFSLVNKHGLCALVCSESSGVGQLAEALWLCDSIEHDFLG
jgi:hypothetical protein